MIKYVFLKTSTGKVKKLKVNARFDQSNASSYILSVESLGYVKFESDQTEVKHNNGTVYLEAPNNRYAIAIRKIIEEKEDLIAYYEEKIDDCRVVIANKTADITAHLLSIENIQKEILIQEEILNG